MYTQPARIANEPIHQMSASAPAPGRTPVPVDDIARVDVVARHGTAVADPREERLDRPRVLGEGASPVAVRLAVPEDPVPGELGGREDRELLRHGQPALAERLSAWRRQQTDKVAARPEGAA